MLVAPVAANAGEVQNIINNEQARINAGARNDTLTRGEYRRLDNGLDRIQAERKRDLRRNDGHLTSAQYARLNRQESRLSARRVFIGVRAYRRGCPLRYLIATHLGITIIQLFVQTGVFRHSLFRVLRSPTIILFPRSSFAERPRDSSLSWASSSSGRSVPSWTSDLPFKTPNTSLLKTASWT